MNENPGLQITLDLKGRACVVLGGDEEAAERVQRLLDAGAKVTVINPTLNDSLRKLTASAKILHRARLFRSSDVQGTVLIINTLRGDAEQAKALYDVALKENVLLSSTDQPQFSTVMMPALVKRGHLRVAVSTSGAAPALASQLRKDLEGVFDERFMAFLNWLARLREGMRNAEPNAEQRGADLREAVAGFKLNASIQYPASWSEEASQPRQEPVTRQ